MTPPFGILPYTPENRTLVANVHPSDWVNPEPAQCYNLVVIGGGTAGLISAAGAAGLGAKVALIERHLLGGDCLKVPALLLLYCRGGVELHRGAGGSITEPAAGYAESIFNRRQQCY